jgi:cell division protease FtsH
LAVLAIQYWWIESRQVETIPYSQFEEMIDAGKIEDVRVGDKYITGTLKEVVPDGRKRFVTVRVEPMLAKRLAERGVTVTGAVENNLVRDILSWIFPVLFFFGIGLLHPAYRRETGHGRPDDDRQEQSQGLHGEGCRGGVRRRGGG